jgi:hypothetical protein
MATAQIVPWTSDATPSTPSTISTAVRKTERLDFTAACAEVVEEFEA